MTEHEILLKKLETTRAELQRAEEKARENIAPFKHEYQQAQQALEAYRAACRAKDATEIARTEFNLAVGDVVRFRWNHKNKSNWRIVAFKDYHADDASLFCHAINVLKSGAAVDSQIKSLCIHRGDFEKIKPKKISPPIDTAREL